MTCFWAISQQSFCMSKLNSDHKTFMSSLTETHEGSRSPQGQVDVTKTHNPRTTFRYYSCEGNSDSTYSQWKKRSEGTFSTEQQITIKGLQGQKRGTGSQKEAEGGKQSQREKKEERGRQQGEVTTGHLFWCWTARGSLDYDSREQTDTEQQVSATLNLSCKKPSN